MICLYTAASKRCPKTETSQDLKNRSSKEEMSVLVPATLQPNNEINVVCCVGSVQIQIKI